MGESNLIFPCKFRDRYGRNVEIRPYREGDFDQLLDMYDRFEPKAEAQGLPPAEKVVRDNWVKGILQGDWHVIVWVDEKLAGQAAFFDMGGGRAEWGIFIHQDYQSAGIGTVLSSLGRVWGAALGLTAAWLVVDTCNERAISVFRKSGYRIKGRMDMEVDMDSALNAEHGQLIRGELATPDPASFAAIVDDMPFSRPAESKPCLFINFDFERRQAPNLLDCACPIVTYRSSLTKSSCQRSGLLDESFAAVIEAPTANFASAAAWHDQGYLANLLLAGSGVTTDAMSERRIGAPDAPGFIDVHKHALRSLGATLAAARLLVETPARVAFNPCGGQHEAAPDRAFRQCYINDSALAVQYLTAKGLRVLYLDLDAHHGEILQKSFENNPNALTCSFYEAGIPPGASGSASDMERFFGDGRPGGHVDVPLPANTNDELYRLAFESVAPVLAGRFKPDIVVAQISADTIAADNTSKMCLTCGGYSEILAMIPSLAPKALFIGGNAGSPDIIARSYALAWSALTRDYFNSISRENGGPPVRMCPPDLQSGAFISEETILLPPEIFSRNCDCVKDVLYSLRKSNPMLR